MSAKLQSFIPILQSGNTRPSEGPRFRDLQVLSESSFQFERCSHGSSE